jgi:hypothetical protein
MVGQAAAVAVKAGYTPVGYDGSGGTENWPGHGPGNHVHITFLTVAEYLSGDSPGGAVGIGALTIPRIKVRGRGPLAGVSQSVADKLRKTANRYISKLQPAVPEGGELASGGGVLTESQFLGFARRAISITGHTDFSADGLLVLARQESGLQVNPPPPHDVNWPNNPSMGLMQVTIDTFHAYHQPGTSTSIIDPVANIAASINYQVARYGGQITFSPYQQGGYVGDDEAPAEAPLRALDLRKLETEMRETLENRIALGERTPFSEALMEMAL